MTIQISCLPVFINLIVATPAPTSSNENITDDEKKTFVSFSKTKRLAAQEGAEAKKMIKDDSGLAGYEGEISIYGYFENILGRQKNKEEIFKDLVAGFNVSRKSAREKIVIFRSLKDGDPSKEKALVENYRYLGQLGAYAELLKEFAKAYPEFKDKLPKNLPIPLTAP